MKGQFAKYPDAAALKMLDEPVKPVHAPAGLVQLRRSTTRPPKRWKLERRRTRSCTWIRARKSAGARLGAVHEDELREGLEKAFDYRGDVTITRKDGSTVEGYIFDRRVGADADRFGCPAFPERRSDEDFDSLLRHRELELYRARYRRRQELGSVAEEVLGEEGRGRNEYRIDAGKTRLVS